MDTTRYKSPRGHIEWQVAVDEVFWLPVFEFRQSNDATSDSASVSYLAG